MVHCTKPRFTLNVILLDSLAYIVVVKNEDFVALSNRDEDLSVESQGSIVDLYCKLECLNGNADSIGFDIQSMTTLIGEVVELKDMFKLKYNNMGGNFLNL